MADFTIDRNQTFNLIAGLAISANGKAPAEQEALAHSIDLLNVHVMGTLVLARELRTLGKQPKAPADLATATRKRITKSKKRTAKNRKGKRR